MQRIQKSVSSPPSRGRLTELPLNETAPVLSVSLSLQLTNQSAELANRSRFSKPSLVANSSISDELVLDVQFAPILNLQLGTSTLSLQTLQEGNDIYFDCLIKANPRSNQALIWRFNDRVLKPSPGVIQSNQSLVLQKVNRKQSGVYRCEVTNSQGTTLSNPIALNIRYAPVCRSSFM